MRSERVLALLAAVGLAGGTTWQLAEPNHRWSFPRDHWAHSGYRNEWWYFTGHLQSLDPPTRRLGYQFTFFRVGLLPERPASPSRWATANLVMGHAAVSDLTGGEHHFSEVLRREMPDLGAFAPFAQNPIAWAVAPAGTDGRWTLNWNGDGFDLAMDDRAQGGMSFRLSTRAVKELVFQGPHGLSLKSQEGSASLYYSLTRLDTGGEVTLGGEHWRVDGQSWMDHELGSNQLGDRQVGWDWFGLQLADGRDLMLLVLRRADGTVDYRSATVVDRGGTHWLDPGQWSARATASWHSSASGCDYPAAWEIEVPGEGLRLKVEPELADQEDRALLANLTYWEGAVRVADGQGRPVGVGYVELTGYGPRNRPPL